MKNTSCYSGSWELAVEAEDSLRLRELKDTVLDLEEESAVEEVAECGHRTGEHSYSSSSNFYQ